MMHPTEIEKILKAQIPGSEVRVRDLTGTMDHFEAVVISDAFRGLGMVEQHQLVYAALKNEMHEAIHALSLKTYTHEDWQKLK